MVAEDNGPGIEDLEKAMEEGYSTAPRKPGNGFGAGMGLPNIKANTDGLDITRVLKAQNWSWRSCSLEKMVNNAGVYYHSVTLDEEKCKGCTNCIKRCPAEAIRVRNGKARIIDRLCIDCGECIRACLIMQKWQ